MPCVWLTYNTAMPATRPKSPQLPTGGGQTRTFYCPGSLWKALTAAAEDTGRSVGSLITEAASKHKPIKKHLP